MSLIPSHCNSHQPMAKPQSCSQIPPTMVFRPIPVHCINNTVDAKERLKQKILESQNSRSLRVNWSALKTPN